MKLKWDEIEISYSEDETNLVRVFHRNTGLYVLANKHNNRKRNRILAIEEMIRLLDLATPKDE